MKNIYITLLLFALTFSSCNKWLTVESEFDVYEESMFANAQGFSNALNGLYVKMAKSNLYGNDLVFGSVEAWSRNYKFPNVDASDNVLRAYESWQYLADFDYKKEGPEEFGERVWLACYSVIASANNLIKNIEKTNVSFEYGEVTKNMIKAEAYAIRALMHFELVRIFAQSPALDNSGVTATVPFVDSYPSIINLPIPTKDVLNRIVADLNKAKEWIKPFDTDDKYPGQNAYSMATAVRLKLTGDNSSDFNGFRGNRLNYYAITQLLARVYLYKAVDNVDYKNAYDNANEIIKLVDEALVYNFIGSRRITNLITANAELNVSPRFHEEIIFGAYRNNLVEGTDGTFGANSYLKPNITFADLFNSADGRLNILINKKYVSKYITEIEENPSIIEDLKLAENIIPVMRLPEAYYIAAEAISHTDLPKAIEIFNTVVEKRGNTAHYELATTTTKTEFLEAIVDEYQREYLGEGYMVYVYKRMNMPIRDAGTLVNMQNRLVLPVPNTEAGTEL